MIKSIMEELKGYIKVRTEYDGKEENYLEIPLNNNENLNAFLKARSISEYQRITILGVSV
jgi:hypothetical protein